MNHELIAIIAAVVVVGGVAGVIITNNSNTEDESGQSSDSNDIITSQIISAAKQPQITSNSKTFVKDNVVYQKIADIEDYVIYRADSSRGTGNGDPLTLKLSHSDAKAESISNTVTQTVENVTGESFAWSVSGGVSVWVTFEVGFTGEHYSEEKTATSNAQTIGSEITKTFSCETSREFRQTESSKYYAGALVTDAEIYYALHVGWNGDSFECYKTAIIVNLSPDAAIEWYSSDSRSFPELQTEQDYNLGLSESEQATIVRENQSEYVQNGTVHMPYFISDVSDFKSVIERFDSANTYFALKADLNFSGVSYAPLKSFNGKLNGYGHKISNVSLPSYDSDSCGFVIHNRGTIQNIKFDNCIYQDITNSSDSSNVTVIAGIVCAYNDGILDNVRVENSSLTNVHIGKILTEIDNRACAGILCGESGTGSVINNSGVIKSTVNVSARTGYDDADAYASGLIGKTSGTVKGCYSYDNTISAFTKGSHTDNFLGIGNKSGTLYSYAGGLVGRVYSSGDVSDCIVFNNTLSATGEDNNQHNYSDVICPENNGSIQKTVLSNEVPSDFDTSKWVKESVGYVYNYNWKS